MKGIVVKFLSLLLFALAAAPTPVENFEAWPLGDYYKPVVLSLNDHMVTVSPTCDAYAVVTPVAPVMGMRALASEYGSIQFTFNPPVQWVGMQMTSIEADEPPVCRCWLDYEEGYNTDTPYKFGPALRNITWAPGKVWQGGVGYQGDRPQDAAISVCRCYNGVFDNLNVR